MVQASSLPSGPVLPTGEQYVIRFGEQRVVVTEVGAALRAYQVAGAGYLDGFDDDQMPTGGRGQVLMPWPNRLEGGSYAFAGERYQLPISEPRTQNASHGLVRWANWDLVAREEARVVLGLVLHPQSGYPFALALELAYSLSAAGLDVHTTARNVGTTPLPFGAGFHPYFTVGTPRIDGALLTLPARTALVMNERMLPGGRASVEGTALDFRAARPIGDARIDACLTDLARDADGRARITLAHPDGAARVTLALDPAFGFIQVYSGDGLPDPAARRRGLAVEPMTCPANAFNSGEGLIVLEPGQSFVASWGVGVS
jgi:aldose 1-epimerase